MTAIKQSLDELAIKWGSDKSSLNHNYMPLYEKYMPKKISKFLEIGCWMGASIKMFKEWFNNEGQFYVMDVFGDPVITPLELQSIGVNSFIGSQDDMSLLKSIKEKFDVIAEDGSHFSDMQVVTFKQMFVNNLNGGGVYICEDIHGYVDPYWRRGVMPNKEDTMIGIFKRLQDGSTDLTSQYITKEESDIIYPLIGEWEMYKDYALFIKKK